MEPLNHLALIWAVVFVANVAAHKSRSTPVLWFLAFGALLVRVEILHRIDRLLAAWHVGLVDADLDGSARLHLGRGEAGVQDADVGDGKVAVRASGDRLP